MPPAAGASWQRDAVTGREVGVTGREPGVPGREAGVMGRAVRRVRPSPLVCAHIWLWCGRCGDLAAGGAGI